MRVAGFVGYVVTPSSFEAIDIGLGRPLERRVQAPLVQNWSECKKKAFTVPEAMRGSQQGMAAWRWHDCHCTSRMVWKLLAQGLKLEGATRRP